ncbi:MAG TPA: flagellin [Steroidobacteraceae bacterium]|jgi:flagellin|nr:flagellin [Steroidobacteraceae bacterium]
MSLVLNTNIASLNAQNNLTGSQASLSQSLERLSSGLRINSAADDAAGLAISQQFTTQINGTNQAVNNANDAVSETQTASGALNTIVNNLQSIRTLAVESANGSNSASDRQALDAQVQQQIAEITQIASQTSFNGLSVLNGSSGVTTYQVGANVGNTISINLTQGVAATQIGQVASSSVAVGTDALTGNLTLAVGTAAAVTVGASVAGALPGQTAGSAFAKAQAVNAANISGLTASASTSVTEATAFSAIVAPTAGTGATTAATASTYNLSINGVNIYAGDGNVAVGTTLTANDVASQINLFSSQDGNVTASVAAGKLTLTAADGSDINVVQTVTAGDTSVGGTPGAPASGTGIDTSISGGVAGAGLVNSGSLTLEANSNIAVAGTDAGDAIGQTAGSIALGTSTLANQNVLTVAGANATIQAVDSALQTVSGFQSQLGAIQNRFTAAVGNLQSTAQNLTQSRSTIQDADFAAETANLTQSQVLEQAGISVLAQANQQPQLILKLLQ